jgi:PiT family inorganic phosphate transporter
MFLASIVLVLLVFLSVMLVAGNNLSACVGPAVGSRVMTRRFGALIGALGFSVGLLLQGSNMTRSVNILLPDASSTLRTEALLVAITVFLIAYKMRVPISLSMSLVGFLGGLSIAQNSTTDLYYATEIVATWIAVPLIAVGISFGLIRLLNRGWPSNFWHRLQAYKILLLVLSFSTAYVTGANTLGMIVAVGGFNIASVLASITAIFIGSFFLSEGPIRRVSKEFFLMRYPNATSTLVTSTILMEIATFFNIPLSITQTTSVAVFGAGMAYKTKLVSAKPFLKVAIGWVIAPLLSFAIGLIIA